MYTYLKLLHMWYYQFLIVETSHYEAKGTAVGARVCQTCIKVKTKYSTWLGYKCAVILELDMARNTSYVLSIWLCRFWLWGDPLQVPLNSDTRQVRVLLQGPRHQPHEIRQWGEGIFSQSAVGKVDVLAEQQSREETRGHWAIYTENALLPSCPTALPAYCSTSALSN